MDIKFSKDSGDSQQKAPDEKKNQSALVLLLLILLGGFTYIYFFTGLIKPQEVQKTAEAPAAAPQIVKMPLPPRDGEVAKPKGTSVATTETPKAAVPVASAPAAKQAVAPATPAAPAKPTAAPAVKTAPIPPVPKPKEEIKKIAVEKPAEKKLVPVVPADKKTAAAAPKTEIKKPAEADSKAAQAKETLRKTAVNDTSKTKGAVSTKPATAGALSIIIGDYVLEEALSADMGRLRKSGFEPIVKPGARKKTPMNRLLVSDFNDRASALSTLEKLKRLTSDAFVIEQGGKFFVYAGSYLQNNAAHSEKERLKAAGVMTTLKQTDITIPSQTLSVGPFTSKQAADAARSKLKSAGIKATLSQ